MNEHQTLILAKQDITSELRENHPNDLSPEIESVVIQQSDSEVFAVVNGMYENLEFYAGNAGNYFNASDDVSVNAKKYLDMDPYTIIMTTNLFHDEACERIHSEHNENE